MMAGERLLLGDDFLSPPTPPPQQPSLPRLLQSQPQEADLEQKPEPEPQPQPPPPPPPEPQPQPQPEPEPERKQAVSVSEWRYSHESDRQWGLRREFISRHLQNYTGPGESDQLQSLSTAWTNHVFLGCKYSPQLMDKILQMAEGIHIGDIPSYELVVPETSKGQKRSISPYAGLSGTKWKAVPRFPRFEPVHFVASSKEEERRDDPMDTDAPWTDPQTDTFRWPVDSHKKYGSRESRPHPAVPRMISNTGEPATSSAFQRPGYYSSGESSLATKLPESMLAAKQNLIERLSATIRRNLPDSELYLGPEKMSYTFILTRCIQACKTNPEYIYASLKEIAPSDIPRNKKFLTDGYACEVRCQSVYLTTGYAGSKNGSRDRATEQAIKLLQKSVEVRVVRRKYRHTYQEDLVVFPTGLSSYDFPPALKPSEDLQSFKNGPGQLSSSSAIANFRQWANFVLIENASDSIGILNNSASFNRVAIEYKYDMMPNRLWRCQVFLEGQCLAEGYGSKKTSKHAAADEALTILQKTQSNITATQVQTIDYSPKGYSRKTDLKDLVVYENSSNPVCTLNDTAQFNKMTVEYVFERLTGLQWKCKVILEKELIAEAIGLKKSVKHDAAEEAVKILKRTQPTVVNNLRRGTIDTVISRNEIRGRSAEEAYQQQIKEDNIGNQLLRKMGWTGGGLGKCGEGIREPISVKEQHKREGLGLDVERPNRISKRDIEQIIRNYARSSSHTNLTFSTEFTSDERKQIHQIAQKYGLKSKSHGMGHDRYLVVGRKRRKEDLLYQLKQEGQVGHYELLMPQGF
ncbi:NF-kappa-B-repressing factor-like [Trichosurus vulpecula]|uniref:NF-kappa-B-repressing factor-like n=1 Tax=Trichosurus vulpecula TaxID=9337 RepID=UPI00186B54DE|nr:NF-kappa-B-repressing factor-like [Trichosurus vulpecula]